MLYAQYYRAHRSDVVPNNDRDLGNVIAIERIHFIINFHSYYFRVYKLYTRLLFMYILIHYVNFRVFPYNIYLGIL